MYRVSRIWFGGSLPELHNTTRNNSDVAPLFLVRLADLLRSTARCGWYGCPWAGLGCQWLVMRWKVVNVMKFSWCTDADTSHHLDHICALPLVLITETSLLVFKQGEKSQTNWRTLDVPWTNSKTGFLCYRDVIDCLHTSHEQLSHHEMQMSLNAKISISDQGGQWLQADTIRLTASFDVFFLSKAMIRSKLSFLRPHVSEKTTSLFLLDPDLTELKLHFWNARLKLQMRPLVPISGHWMRLDPAHVVDCTAARIVFGGSYQKTYYSIL